MAHEPRRSAVVDMRMRDEDELDILQRVTQLTNGSRKQRTGLHDPGVDEHAARPGIDEIALRCLLAMHNRHFYPD